MELALLVYIVSVIGSVIPLAVTVFSFGSVTTVILVLVYIFSSNEDSLSYHQAKYDKAKADNTELSETTISVLAYYKNLSRYIKISAIATAIAVFVSVFIPSEKVAWTMVGAYATQTVATSEAATAIGSKTLKLIEGKLDGILNEAANNIENKVENATN